MQELLRNIPDYCRSTTFKRPKRDGRSWTKSSFLFRIRQFFETEKKWVNMLLAWNWFELWICKNAKTLLFLNFLNFSSKKVTFNDRPPRFPSCKVQITNFFAHFPTHRRPLKKNWPHSQVVWNPSNDLLLFLFLSKTPGEHKYLSERTALCLCYWVTWHTGHIGLWVSEQGEKEIESERTRRWMGVKSKTDNERCRKV